MAKVATRESYGNALAQYGSDERIIVMDADLSKSTKTATFKAKYPERFFNAGIAEASMITTAAGMATCGKIVFASSFAMFAAGRAFEQIRNSIAYPHLNVKIAATHAGITVGEDGATHQCLEDLALMRSLPGMVVLNPADDTEAKQCVKAAIDHVGPVYLRFGRLAVEDVFDSSYKFEIGKGSVVSEGTDVSLVATGMMLSQALAAKELLKSDGINARVINIATIKPIDKDIIINASHETGAIVTCEEHNVIGGLGSAVSEVLCENAPCIMRRIGTQDVFGRSGKPKELLDYYKMNPQSIAAAAKEAISKKH